MTRKTWQRLFDAAYWAMAASLFGWAIAYSWLVAAGDGIVYAVNGDVAFRPPLSYLGIPLMYAAAIWYVMLPFWRRRSRNRRSEKVK